MGLGPRPRSRCPRREDAWMGFPPWIGSAHELALARRSHEDLPRAELELKLESGSDPGSAEVSRTQGSLDLRRSTSLAHGPHAGRCPSSRACPRARSARAPPVTQSMRRRSDARRYAFDPAPRALALAKELVTRDPLERPALAVRPPTPAAEAGARDRSSHLRRSTLARALRR